MVATSPCPTIWACQPITVLWHSVHYPAAESGTFQIASKTRRGSKQAKSLVPHAPEGLTQRLPYAVAERQLRGVIVPHGHGAPDRHHTPRYILAVCTKNLSYIQ